MALDSEGKWEIAKLGSAPLWVMDEACRSGFVPVGLWAGEGLWSPDGDPEGDQSKWKISQGLADAVLAECAAFSIWRKANPKPLGGLPSWAPWVAAGAVALFLWSRR